MSDTGKMIIAEVLTTTFIVLKLLGAVSFKWFFCFSPMMVFILWEVLEILREAQENDEEDEE